MKNEITLNSITFITLAHLNIRKCISIVNANKKEPLAFNFWQSIFRSGVSQCVYNVSTFIRRDTVSIWKQIYTYYVKLLNKCF